MSIEPEIAKQIRKFGRNCCCAAKGDLSLIVRSVLAMSMLHRPFIEAATSKFVQYAKAEGFENQHELMMERLEAMR